LGDRRSGPTCFGWLRGDSAVDELGWWKLLQDLWDTLPDALEVAAVVEGDVPAGDVRGDGDRLTLPVECVPDASVRNVVVADDLEGRLGPVREVDQAVGLPGRSAVVAAFDEGVEVASDDRPCHSLERPFPGSFAAHGSSIRGRGVRPPGEPLLTVAVSLLLGSVRTRLTTPPRISAGSMRSARSLTLLMRGARSRKHSRRTCSGNSRRGRPWMTYVGGLESLRVPVVSPSIGA
jgi:hypothetical protein